MTQYLLFIALLTVVYLGYLFVQAREKKRMKRYYGHSRRREGERNTKKAA
jgi:hypothetical protein